MEFPNVDLWATLEKIRYRPAMWIGKKSLDCLSAFIAGLWHFDGESHGAGPKCLNLVSDPPYDEFMRVLNGELYGGPYSEAMKIAGARNPSATEEELDVLGFDIWFELLDEFKQEHTKS